MKIRYRLIYLLFIVLIGLGQRVSAADAPYPASPVIASITWDFNNLVRMAPGSDLWPVTWASDNNLYMSWGDGGGFDGTNTDGRVSLGFARVEGPPEDLVGYNVWGGKYAENPSQFGGKCPGMLSVQRILYAWINMQNSAQPDFKLAWSEDFGAHWQLVNWNFTGDTFAENTFLNYGKDYSGVRDDFVYIYGLNREYWTSVELARALKDKIKDRSAYEWYTGMDTDGKPTWSPDIARRKPVFEDPNGVGIPSVIYSPGIDRYILTTAHRGVTPKLGIFDAPEPWGPWTTVAYYDNWGGFSGEALIYSFPTKWISADGKTMWCIFSSTGELDSFNLIKASLTIGDTSPPDPPRGFRILDGK